MGEAMIVAGVGCRRGASAADIEAAIAAALAGAELGWVSLDVIATTAAKADEPGLTGAAARLGLPLISIAQAEMEGAGTCVRTYSARVMALTGVPSVAEAAALAAAGPAGRLIVPRVAVGPATCALAASGDAP